MDVIVLGAGPAGISAAIALKKHGLDVEIAGLSCGETLKVGESLPGATQRFFKRLGFDHLSDIMSPDDYIESAANISAWGEDKWYFQDGLRNPEGGGWHILRHKFEQGLLAYAKSLGITLRLGKLVSLADNGAEYQITLDHAGQEKSLQATCLLDATGRNGWAVRRLAGTPKKQSEQMAIIGWLNVDSKDCEQSTRITSVKDGWWYTARLPQNLRVIAFHGLPSRIQMMYKDKHNILDALQESPLIDHVSFQPENLQGLQCRDASVRLSPRLAGSRWMAIGDAALSFDPLSSQGLYFSFYSAVKASDALYKSFQKPDMSYEFMSKYCDEVSEIFKTNQRARYLFYIQEKRFPTSLYWQSQINRFN